MYSKILTVLGLATFEVYAAIPTGLALDLSPWLVFLACVIGGFISVGVAAFFGKNIRDFIAKFKKPKERPNGGGFCQRLWNRHGTMGLGLLGTMSVGAGISIGLGLSLNASLKKLITWSCIGVVARCAIFTLIGYYGFEIF